MAEPFVLDGARAREGAPQVRIAPGEALPDAETLRDVSVVGILFPGFRDGRGYSTARMLRERGFDGDIRAIGDVTVDQLFFLLRTGFSSLEPDHFMELGRRFHVRLSSLLFRLCIRRVGKLQYVSAHRYGQ